MELDSCLPIGNEGKGRHQGGRGILSLDKWNADLTINKRYPPL